MLGRFRKATNRRLALLQDEARRTGKLNPSTAISCGTFNDEAILETFAFEAAMEPAKKHPVHKTIATFLEGQGIHASDSELPIALIVSLSGGVDSMAIASVLSHMKKSCDYNLKVIAGT
jgi:predicted PP-loop superfamily ATPase